MQYHVPNGNGCHRHQKTCGQLRVHSEVVIHLYLMYLSCGCYRNLGQSSWLYNSHAFVYYMGVASCDHHIYVLEVKVTREV